MRPSSNPLRPRRQGVPVPSNRPPCVCARTPHTPRVCAPECTHGPHAVRVHTHTHSIALTLADMPTGVPFEVKVRRLLKIAGRSLGLKCVEMRDVSHDDSTSSVNVADATE